MANLSSILYLQITSGSEPNLDNSPPGLILEEADAILDQARVEDHLGLGLVDADAPDDHRLLAGPQHILDARHGPLLRRTRRDRPAIGIALGRAAAVGVPIHTDAPVAAGLDGVCAPLNRREDVVGAVL